MFGLCFNDEPTVPQSGDKIVWEPIGPNRSKIQIFRGEVILLFHEKNGGGLEYCCLPWSSVDDALALARWSETFTGVEWRRSEDEGRKIVWVIA